MFMQQAASGMVFQNHRRVPVGIFMAKIVSSEPLKRITGRFWVIPETQVKKLKIKYRNSKILKNFGNN